MNRNIFSSVKYRILALYAYIARHPWLCSFLLCVIASLVVWYKEAVILHTDDIQLQFLLTDGGCGYSPYILHSGYLWGCLWSMMERLFPMNAAWLLLAHRGLLFIALWIACFLLFSRSFSKLKEQDSFYLCSRTALILLMFFCTRELLSLPMYTLIAISLLLVGLSIVFLLREGLAAWKRYSLGAMLCFLGLCVRLDSLYVGVIYGGMLSGLVFFFEGKRVWKQVGICGLGLMGIAGCVWGSNYLGYVQNQEIVKSLDFLKKRVAIQDVVDNSGIDKYDRYIRECQMEREQIDMFKAFNYIVEMEEPGKIDQVMAIHQEGMRGLFGCDWLAKRGILSPNWGELLKIRQSLGAQSLWVAFFLAIFLYVFVPRKFWPIPVLYGSFVACIVFLLLTQHRLLDRVYLPALMISLVGLGACLPKKPDIPLERWKLYILVVVVSIGTLFVFRHDRHGLMRFLNSDPAAASDRVTCREYMEASPDTIFVCVAPLEMLFPESVLAYPGDLFSTTNVVPVGGAWFYYAPAYKSFLAAHGMEDPYVALLQKRVIFLVGSYTSKNSEGILHAVKKSVERKTGQNMEWRLIEDQGQFSCWKAVRADF